jgi:hypothetical protein
MPTVQPKAAPERTGVLGSVLNWLRKGYPEGVPPKDYFPLLALLKKRLTDDDIDAVVADLESSGLLVPDRAALADAIERVARQQPDDEDVALVAARLAAAGWPLAEVAPVGGDQVKSEASDGAGRSANRPALLSSILGWLRVGYPQGVPAQDYIPLLALLRRRLSDEETVWVAKEILASGHAPVGAADIGVLISKVTNEMPSEADVQRVREHLEAAGWPVVPSSDGTDHR